MDASVSKQVRRNVSGRASLPRRATRGPLDAPADPLGSPTSSVTSPTAPHPPPLPLDGSFPKDEDGHGLLSPPSKDFSFLLRPEIYHPISQLDVPAPFRTHFPPAPDTNLEHLLATGHYLPAAALAASQLTSPNLSPTNSAQIFHLLYVRLACLTLTGNTVLAAQESKCLEDLNSNFYYAEPMGGGTSHEHDLEHIVPWELRVLAVRLQSIGFSDGRRGVGGYYELGAEARQKYHKSTSLASKEMWRSRISDLGIRVINAQIEMGDLEGAREELNSQMKARPDESSMNFRLALLLMRTGHVRKAREVLGPKPEDGSEGVLLPLLSMAEGRIHDAVKQWEDLNLKYVETDQEALVAQNLAVCLLYAGRLKEARSILENLISNPSSGSSSSSSIPAFHSLTFNLATLYELCSEKSTQLKNRLAERVARKAERDDFGFEICEEGWEKVNGDFKL